MSAEPNFEQYLRSIVRHYEQWWRNYAITDVIAQKKTSQTAASPFRFDLMAKSVPSDPRKQEIEEIERMPVIDGIRQYAKQHVLLVGKPGSGKSTTLARLLLEEAERCQKTVGRIPVLVELRDWEGSVLERIQAFLQKHDSALYLSETELKQLLSQGQFLVLLDGLNELPSNEARRNVSRFEKDYPRTPMIFTTRNREISGDLGVKKQLEMEPLSASQMRQFVLAYLPERGESLLQQLQGQSWELAETPLLLWMLCTLFQQTGTVPSNLGLAFREFTRGYEQDLKQNVPVKSDRNQWSSRLQSLAFSMMQGKDPIAQPTEFLVAIDRSNAETILTQSLEGRPYPAQIAQDSLDDWLNHHLLEINAQKIQFKHQLIQEYYAAEHLLRQLPNLLKDENQLKRNYLNYLKWTEPIALMLSLVEDKAQAVQIVKLALKVDLMLGARLAVEVEPKFQEQTVGLIANLNIPELLKIQLLDITKSEYAISVLYNALQNKDSDIGWSAAETLGKIGTESAINALIKALNDRNTEIRRIAAYGLGEVGSVSAVDALKQALNDENHEVRREAAVSLGRIGSESAVDALIRALHDRNYEVRKEAAWALGKIGGSSAVHALIQALNDHHDYVRGSAASALGKTGSELAVNALIRVLQNDRDEMVRRGAAEALGKIGGESVVEVLIQAFNDEKQNLWVCRAIAVALGKIGGSSAINALKQFLNGASLSFFLLGAGSSIVEALVRIGDQLALDALIITLHEGNTTLREKIANAISNSADEAFVAALKETLHCQKTHAREGAVYVLSEIGSASLDKTVSESATKILRETLYDQEPLICQSAAKALGKIGSESAIAALIQAFESDNPGVRWFVGKALSEIDSRSAIDTFVRALEHKDPYVRWRAANALGKIGDQLAIDNLIKTARNIDMIPNNCAVVSLIENLRSKNPFTRWSAADALTNDNVEFSVADFTEILFHEDADIRRSSGYVLSKTPPAMNILMQILPNENYVTRELAAKAFGKTGSEFSIALLVQDLHNEISLVRERVVETLAEIGSEQAVVALHDALKDEWSSVREKAIEALGRIGSEQAVVALHDALKDEWSSVREKAIEALGRIGGEQAVVALHDALKDEWFGIREKAVRSLKIIGSPPILPQLQKTLLETVDSALLSPISAIQERCKFYNYEIYQQTQESIKQEQSKNMKIDFAILTALELERKAVCDAFGITDADTPIRKGNYIYWRKQFPLKSRKLRAIVIAQAIEMGNVQASILTTETIRYWNPNYLLVAGIAAAATPRPEADNPSPKQRLGDLVIGQGVYYPELGKLTPEGKLPDPWQVPAHPWLRSLVQAVPKSAFSILADRPDGTDIHPRVEPGVIASVDNVIANPVVRDEITSHSRQIKAIEMEGYGVSAAALQNDKPCLIIRALCDYADETKDDTWQPYAAASAAGFVKHLLMFEVLEEEAGNS